MPPKKNSYRKKGGLKKYIKKVVANNTETKSVITQYANQIQDSARTPLSNQIALCIQGLTQQTRVGNRMTVTSMKYDWFFTGADATNSIRVLIYVPKDPNNLMTGLGFNQPPDLDQFTILKDFFIPTGGTGGNCKRKQGWIRFNRGNRSGMNVEYTGATTASVIRNNLSVYMVSDSLVASDPECNGYTRVFFKDA